MAKSPMPALVPVQPYPQVERESPASTRTYGFAPFDPAKGDLLTAGMPAPDAFAENPDQSYQPFVITRRRGA